MRSAPICWCFVALLLVTVVLAWAATIPASGQEAVPADSWEGVPQELVDEVAVVVALVAARSPLPPAESGELLAALSEVEAPLDAKDLETLRPLSEAGVSALPVLEQALRSEDPSLRASASTALRLLMSPALRLDYLRIVEDLTLITPLALRSTFDPEATVRRQSIVSLGRIVRSLPPQCRGRVIVALRRLLHDPDPTAVNLAAEILFEAGLLEGIPPEQLRLLEATRGG